MSLHAHKLRPPILLRTKLHHSKLIRPHATRANIMHFPHGHKIMQRLHRLLNGRVLVEAVDLEQIEVVCAEALEGAFDVLEDGGARETAAVDVVFVGVGDGAVFLRGEAGARKVRGGSAGARPEGRAERKTYSSPTKPKHLLSSTSFSRGSLYSLIALPMIVSECPLLYTLAARYDQSSILLS